MRGVHRLVEVDVVRLCAREIGDPQPEQAFVALDQHPEVLEEVHLLEHHQRPVRDHLAPALRRGIVDRRAHQPEVGALVVGADEKLVLAMVDVILESLAPLLDHAELAPRIIRAQDANFRGVLAHAGEHHERFAPRFGHADVELLVALLVDHFRSAFEHAPVEAVAALGGLVFLDVEEGRIVGGPRERGYALDGVAKQAARGEVLHLQRVLAKAGEIHGVRELGAVRAHVHCAELGELASLCELVYVEQQVLGRLHRRLSPCVDRILEALDFALVIPVAVLEVRNALVGFLDAREHLLVELLAECLERLHDRFRVAILRVEVVDDLGTGLLAKPEIVVDSPVAEFRQDLGLFCRDRSLERLGRLRGEGGGGGQEHGEDQG